MDLLDDSIENTFNINQLLITLFSSVKSILDERDVELIYDMDSTIPRELRGDSEVTLQLLTKLLTFLIKNCNSNDIVLALSAHEDFIYEEDISFKISGDDIDKKEILNFLEKHLNKELKALGARIIDDHTGTTIHLSIPFTNSELGFRRHYRLPDEAMVAKKVLLICDSDTMAQSLKKMFAYFLYDVEIEINELERNKNNLHDYDIVIIGENIVTAEMQEAIHKVQKSSQLKYVSLQEADDTESEIEHGNLIKPITQEKIFDLIVSVYDYGSDTQEVQTDAPEEA